ncbi:hypothetical protein [Micromonospora sp. NPDC047527]|uniref:hypothetical protein n=1 Tax=unclassified Micromonospora TaxID=2617518 RepID=UPI0033F0B682
MGSAAALVAAGVTIPATAAQADDSGNGTVVCVVGEICFSSDKYGGNTMRKQFYNGANHGANSKHGDYLWFYVPGGYTTNERVMDGAEHLNNRDTACTVYVWDVDGYGNWFTYVSVQNDGMPFPVRSATPRNNGHSRCGGSSSYNPKNL